MEEVEDGFVLRCGVRVCPGYLIGPEDLASAEVGAREVAAGCVLHWASRGTVPMLVWMVYPAGGALTVLHVVLPTRFAASAQL